jgi:hypothetical protein
MTQKYSTDDLFRMLREACQAQFGFNPTQVSAGMRYMGPHGKSRYRFRDTGTHSEVILDAAKREATLVKENEGRDYWDDAEMAYYRQSDAEIRSARDGEETKALAARTSPLFLKHAAYLRTLFRDHPSYQDGGPTPMEGAKQLIQAALDAGDPDVQSFAGAIGTRDANSLTHWLLHPVSEELQDMTYERIRANPKYAEALQLLLALRAVPKDVPKSATKADEARFNEMTQEICRTTKGAIFMSFVYGALRDDAKLQELRATAES